MVGGTEIQPAGAALNPAESVTTAMTLPGPNLLTQTTTTTTRRLAHQFNIP